ncbi:MAG: helix-turn-helix domain-containing protein [Planctomycetes bacterium]|nr:helix-turn-helix domain-containing protein [Planctomycetota bacterium]
MEADLSIKQLAEVTGRHVESLRCLARMGRLPGVYRLGGRWMISREAADRLRKVADDEGARQ